MAADEQFDRFRKCAADVLSTPLQQITPEARFREDFGVDSLDLIELVSALEREFDIEVDSDAIVGVETVGQAFALIQAQL